MFHILWRVNLHSSLQFNVHSNLHVNSSSHYHFVLYYIAKPIVSLTSSETTTVLWRAAAPEQPLTFEVCAQFSLHQQPLNLRQAFVHSHTKFKNDNSFEFLFEITQQYTYDNIFGHTD